MKYWCKCIASAVGILALSGCATMFHGAKQQVSLRSNVADAELYVNETYIGRNSAVTSFNKNKNYVITARKAGCSDTSVPASRSFDAITLLGIPIDFGIFSVLIIDGASTGAWMNFDQDSYVVDPVCA